MHDFVDLRSDTLTLPTPEMREAMARAEVGDDVWGEDPTIQRLEALAAERLGKEAGLFVTSGTQGNLVSVVAHTRAGQEVVLDLDSHIYNYEVAGAATVGHVQMRPTQTARGSLSAFGLTADEDAQRLAEIVVRLVGSGLDQLHVAEMLRERAAAGERVRLSRDLHDGLLQTLGAVAVHLEAR